MLASWVLGERFKADADTDVATQPHRNTHTHTATDLSGCLEEEKGRAGDADEVVVAVVKEEEETSRINLTLSPRVLQWLPTEGSSRRGVCSTVLHCLPQWH